MVTRTLSELQGRFTVPGVVRFEEGEGGLNRAVLTTAEGEAHVYLHGAHVTHFQPRGQAPALFMSAKSYFQEDKPIRGGVPICFPWFSTAGPDPEAPAHGFARLMSWTVDMARANADGSATLILKLDADDRTRALWPGEFEISYLVTVGRTLDMGLAVRNTGAAAFSYEEALHTYLAVADVRQVSVEGLAQTTYIDKTQAGLRQQQGPEPIAIVQETDRIYVNTRSTCVVHDPVMKRRIRIAKQGSKSTVVWNPWIAKAQAMADFGDEEWTRMLCIETCNVGESAVRIQGGAFHVMRATVSVEGP